MKLDNKIAIVTGGASGLGEAIARGFARDGAAVAIADLNIDAARSFAELLASTGAKAIAVPLNVADVASVKACVAKVTEQLGPIDILVNCAGIAHVQPFVDTAIEDYDRVHKINVRGTFLMAQEVVRTMLGRSGNVINIASSAGRRGNYGLSAYGSGKAAIIRLTEIMAVELAVHGIRVNAIAPGPIDTPLVLAHLDAAGRASWNSVVPMRRFGKPEEIATVASFLASTDASFITGHCLDADGGFHAGGILEP
jgi:3-oxoacyl-[acyl-carrier protein] reductase